jgi:predicted nuclease of restriction endonuclease-like (RecB) superfamily
MNNSTPTHTTALFSDVLQHIQQTRQKIFSQANTGLIDLYWQIGKTISHKVQSEAWGKGVVTELARYITQNAPDIKGFSDEKLSALARELPWTHNTLIFSRCKTAEERAFYLSLCSKEHYSSRELERQIDSAQFERTLIGQQKLSTVLRELHPSITNTFKDNYVLEFLGLPETHSEN